MHSYQLDKSSSLGTTFSHTKNENSVEVEEHAVRYTQVSLGTSTYLVGLGYSYEMRLNHCIGKVILLECTCHS